jgi:hypothetical protein
MKIIICGSIGVAEKILAVKSDLEKAGHEVEIPEGVKHLNEWEGGEAGISEKAERKIKNDLIRGYYEKIKNYDAVLIVNPERKGIAGYIGGNTFLEMGFAHVLSKKIFCLFPLPDISYLSEIIAMRPVILNGDLNNIY